MFYSYDILTNRKHGISTIWLMATLGSTATLKKKVQVKNILSVNLPKAIETILLPEAPLALRLQSNLLYGVSRVYLHQCNYTLKQAQNAHEQMLKMLAITKGSNIDSDKSQTAKKEQLVLQDDPSFMPEVQIPSLEDFFPDIDILQDYHLQNSPVASRSLSSNQSVPGIVVPSSDSGPGQIGERSESAMSDIDAQQVRTLAHGASQASLRANHAFLQDPLFTIDADGNMHDIVEEMPFQHNNTYNLLEGRDDHRGVCPMGNTGMDAEEAPPLMLDNIDDAGLSAPHIDLQQHINGQHGSHVEHYQTVENANEGDEDLEYVMAAAKRHTRGPRLLPLDQRIQLAPDELRSFNYDYADHMQEATEAKFRHQAPAIAKKNAQYWVWGRGIGAIGKDFSSVDVGHPFSMFFGKALYESVMGVSMNGYGESAPGSARKRQRAQDEIDIGRQVRSRLASADQELERNTDLMDLDSGGLGITEDEPEIGRRAPTPLAADHQSDISSSLPWNRSGSFRQGGSIKSIFRGLQSHARGRLSSASPLMRRGSQPAGGGTGSLAFNDRFGVSNSSLMGNDVDDDDSELLGALEDTEDFETHGTLPEPEEIELYGAAAYVDTQTAAGSQWTHTALDQESSNFLEFFKNAIISKKDTETVSDTQEEGAHGMLQNSVTFEELLPCSSNTAIVAAQGLLHSLALATKNVLRLEQHNHFGDIAMTLVQGK